MKKLHVLAVAALALLSGCSPHQVVFDTDYYFEGDRLFYTSTLTNKSDKTLVLKSACAVIPYARLYEEPAGEYADGIHGSNLRLDTADVGRLSCSFMSGLEEMIIPPHTTQVVDEGWADLTEQAGGSENVKSVIFRFGGLFEQGPETDKFKTTRYDVDTVQPLFDINMDIPYR